MAHSLIGSIIAAVHFMFLRWPFFHLYWSVMVLNINVELPLLLPYLLRWTKVTDTKKNKSPLSVRFGKTLLTCEKKKICDNQRFFLVTPSQRLKGLRYRRLILVDEWLDMKQNSGKKSLKNGINEMKPHIQLFSCKSILKGHCIVSCLNFLTEDRRSTFLKIKLQYSVHHSIKCTMTV